MQLIHLDDDGEMVIQQQTEIPRCLFFDPKDAVNLFEPATNTTTRIFNHTWSIPRRNYYEEIVIMTDTTPPVELIKFVLLTICTGIMKCDVWYMNTELINTCSIKVTIPGYSSTNTGDNTGDDNVEDKTSEFIINEKDFIEIGNVNTISANNFNEQGFVEIPIQIKYSLINQD